MLANRANLQKIKVRLSIVGMVHGPFGTYCVQRPLLKSKDTAKLYIMLHIINTGNKPITIQSTDFYMDFKIPKQKIVINSLDLAWNKNKYPKVLPVGSSDSFIIQCYDAFLDNVILNEALYNNLKHFNMFVFPNVSKKYPVKISKQIRKEILWDAKQKKEAKNSNKA